MTETSEYHVPVEYEDMDQEIWVHAETAGEAEERARMIVNWNDRDVVSFGPARTDSEED